MNLVIQGNIIQELSSLKIASSRKYVFQNNHHWIREFGHITYPLPQCWEGANVWEELVTVGKLIGSYLGSNWTFLLFYEAIILLPSE